ncbi:MAG: hypothetical protein OXQ28_03855, partial [Acidobacteriota bacterium]|nr:hypothetical protein [Acidobacteriota bacterium]
MNQLPGQVPAKFLTPLRNTWKLFDRLRSTSTWGVMPSRTWLSRGRASPLSLVEPTRPDELRPQESPTFRKC